LQEWLELPDEIVRRAAEFREQRSRGETEDPLLHSARSVLDQMALCVSYGHPEDVPPEAWKALEKRRHRDLAGSPEQMKDEEYLWRALLDEAFERGLPQ